MLLFKRMCVVVSMCVAVSCGGSSSSSPASPSPSTPSTPAATRVMALSGILAFGNVTGGTTASATLTITNNGSTPLTVSSLSLPTSINQAYIASFTSGTIAAGASQAVTIRFSPIAAQDYGGTLTVNADQTSGTNTTAVSGVGVLAAGVAATRIISVAGNLTFGNVAVGQTGQAVMTITNSGNSTLTVTSLSTSACGTDYTASWTSGTIPPGGSQQVTIFFKPQAAQACNSTFTVHGDQTSGTSTLAGSGTGTGAAPAPPPSPATGGKYDGVYDFFFKSPAPGGVFDSQNLRSFMIIRGTVISSSDGTLNGTVDLNFGSVRMTSACPINNSLATWTGTMNASAQSGSNFGQGTYTCAIAIGGGASDSWQATQSGR
jgi:copper(I)-binding protein